MLRGLVSGETGRGPGTGPREGWTQRGMARKVSWRYGQEGAGPGCGPKEVKAWACDLRWKPGQGSWRPSGGACSLLSPVARTAASWGPYGHRRQPQASGSGRELGGETEAKALL